MEVTLAICIFATLWVIFKLFDFLYRRPEIENKSNMYIFITGCDSGFGKLTAQRLDTLGCHVFAACLTEAGEAELREMTSSRCVTLRLDVTKHESVLEASEFVKKLLPPNVGLWAILNNAGIAQTFGPPEFLNLRQYQRHLDVNLLGLIDVTTTFLPLVKRERGRVVNIASMYGRYSYHLAIPYCISKFGVEAFSDGLRRCMIPWNVGVSIIEPGYTLGTNMLSSELMKAMLAGTYENAQQEALEAYGEGFLEKCVGRKFLCSIMAANPSEVVRSICHAVLSQHPRARYVIGRDARYFFLPLGWLPEWLGDWLFLKLTNYPTPAKLRH